MQRFVGRSLFALLWILLFSSPGRAQTMDARMRQEDKRLQAPVTFASRRVFLGELLETLSRQTGVPLRVEEQDTAWSLQLAVYLNKMPLVAVMNALRSLGSYQQAEWMWKRSGTADHYAYQLARSEAAVTWAAQWRKQIEDAYEQEALTLLEFANLSPDLREKKAEQDPSLKPWLTDARSTFELRMFAQTVPPAQRLEILRGQASVRIPIEKLSKEGQAFVETEWRHAGGGAPRPGWIEFGTFRGRDEMAPTFSITLETLGTYRLIGGRPLDQRFQKSLAAQWIVPGDGASDPIELRPIPPAEQDDPRLHDYIPETPVSGQYESRINGISVTMLEERLAPLAEAGKLSFIAQLPFTQHHTISPGDDAELKEFMRAPYNMTVRRFLQLLQGYSPYKMHKWRDGILLLNSPTAMYTLAADLPGTRIKQFWQAQEAHGGYLSAKEIASALDTLSEEQVDRLQEKLPILKSAKTLGLFALYPRYPQIVSEDGLKLDEQKRPLLTNPGTLPSNFPPLEKALAVRLVDKPGWVSVEYLANDQRWHPVIDITQIAHLVH